MREKRFQCSPVSMGRAEKAEEVAESRSRGDMYDAGDAY